MNTDFFTEKVTKDTKEQSINRYTRLTSIVNDDSANDAEKQDAREEALLYMRDFVKNLISKKYSSYISKDPSFYDDLFMSSMESIITYLPGYDPEKGAPTTYFGLAVKNALYTETTRKFGKNSPQALLSRRVQGVVNKYENNGKTPTVKEIADELDKTEKQIRDILCLIGLSGASCLDNVRGYQDGILSGNADNDESYRSPEDIVVENISHDELISRIEQSLSPVELTVFRSCILDNRKYGEFNVKKNDYRKLLRKVKNIILNDEEILEILGKRG